MSYTYPLSPDLNMQGAGRVSANDAARQSTTASEILDRFALQPGLILADEVGMGKTFVALAVAVSVALGDKERRPVVVMMPPSLKEKWPRDFTTFTKRCILGEAASKLTCATAESAVEFLKLLDDPVERRASVIFLTHGAMSPQKKLQDGWVKLAIIQRALKYRKEADKIRIAVGRFAGELLRMRWITQQNDSIWEKLLAADPKKWAEILKKHGVKLANVTNPDDDPVPEAILEAIEGADLNDVYASLASIPIHRTKTFESRLAEAREVIGDSVSGLWVKCITGLSLKLPLLILDEAHHLKNPGTRLASLFQSQEAKDDADEVTKGPLAGVFERMLFLTATPFQLGHYELCSVLQRFDGIAWDSPSSPRISRQQFTVELKMLSTKLDAAQMAAARLDREWGKLSSTDLWADGEHSECVDAWWKKARTGTPLTPAGSEVMKCFDEVMVKMQEAENELRPHVIRHLRSRTLFKPHEGKPRRRRHAGRSILDDSTADNAPGLSIDKGSVLPFLLAARVSSLNPTARPVFGEGLASSYEAFIHTRKAEGAAARDSDDDLEGKAPLSSASAEWYLNQLETCLPRGEGGSFMAHPKVEATAQKAVELWSAGEKVVIFCHYLATGRALRNRISEAIAAQIRQLAAKRLGCSPQEAEEALERIGKRFFDEDSPVRRAFDQRVEKMLADYPVLKSHTSDLTEITRRFVRTPSFLARFFPLSKERLSEREVVELFQTSDRSNMTLEKLLKDFFKFLSEQSEAEQAAYVRALESIQTGSHAQRDAMRSFSEEERVALGSKALLLPNVRLANGETRQDARQRLMLTFNTPFYPEVLIASMIMAEGVDLHLNCRHIIHHDLCWNPSTLEQRTGRIDRIGAKVERCGEPIRVYLPYISETQDEKMYRVVMDRERWFKVVMGEDYKSEVGVTDKIAERLLFPDEAAQELMLDLRVVRDVV